MPEIKQQILTALNSTESETEVLAVSTEDGEIFFDLKTKSLRLDCSKILVISVSRENDEMLIRSSLKPEEPGVRALMSFIEENKIRGNVNISKPFDLFLQDIARCTEKITYPDMFEFYINADQMKIRVLDKYRRLWKKDESNKETVLMKIIDFINSAKA